MCGRYSLDVHGKSPAHWLEHFLVDTPPPASRFNAAPGDAHPVIREQDNARVACSLHWGLVPHWAKTRNVGFRNINARSETVARKRAYADAFRSRRCLVPATGFFEWKPKTRTQKKQPYHFFLKDAPVFAFAGIWGRHHLDEGDVLESFCILTTPANAHVAPIHDRMPVILSPESYETWLSPDEAPERLASLLQPFPADRLRSHPVSPRVGKPAFDQPECIARVEVLPPKQGELF